MTNYLTNPLSNDGLSMYIDSKIGGGGVAVSAIYDKFPVVGADADGTLPTSVSAALSANTGRQIYNLAAAAAPISSLSTVATSGSYNDLSNKPTIPAAQVSSDWNSIVSPTQILNKPTIPNLATSSSFGTSSTTGVSVGVATQTLNLLGTTVSIGGTTIKTVATTGAYSDLSGAPTIPSLTTSSSFGTSSTTGVSVGVSGQSLTIQGVPNPITLGGSLSDETTTLTTANQLSIRVPFAFSIRTSALPYWWVNALPTATTAITFDILKNGTSIYTTTKPTLSSTATNNSCQNGNLITNPTSFVVGDLLVARVSIVGSGTPNGAKVVIYNS